MHKMLDRTGMFVYDNLLSIYACCKKEYEEEGNSDEVLYVLCGDE